MSDGFCGQEIDGGGKVKRPVGWYSKAAKAERAAQAASDRQARADARGERAADRAALEATLAPLRATAARRLAALPPRMSAASTREVIVAAATREAERVEGILRRDRQDARAARKRANAEVEIARGRLVSVADVEDRPTPEQLAKGDYAQVTVEKAKGSVRKVTALKNRGGTAVERWYTRGDLNRGQAEAIALYARAWRLRYELNDRVTANWSLVSGLRGGTTPFGEFIANQQVAKNLLDHLDNVVFFAMPLHWFEVWKRVVIEDEAAGVAGSKLGFRSKQAEAAAKTIVLLIADMIAVDMRLGDA